MRNHLSVSDVARSPTYFTQWVLAHNFLFSTWDKFEELQANDSIVSLLRDSLPKQRFSPKFVKEYTSSFDRVFPRLPNTQSFLCQLLETHPALCTEDAAAAEAEYIEDYMLLLTLEKNVRRTELRVGETDLMVGKRGWMTIYESILQNALDMSGGTSTTPNIYKDNPQYGLPIYQDHGQKSNPKILTPVHCQPASVLFVGEPKFSPEFLTDTKSTQELLVHEVSVLQDNTTHPAFPTLQFEKYSTYNRKAIFSFENAHVNQAVINATSALRHRAAFGITEPLLTILFEEHRASLLVHWCVHNDDGDVESWAAQVPGSIFNRGDDYLYLSNLYHILHLHDIIVSMDMWTSTHFSNVLHTAKDKFDQAQNFQWKKAEGKALGGQATSGTHSAP